MLSRPRTSRCPSALLFACLLMGCATPLLAAKAPKVAILDGTVKDEAGTALAGVEITLTSPNQDDWSQSTVSDAEGSFSLEVERPKGGFLYRLTLDGFDPVVGAVELKGGERTSFDFVLERTDGPQARKRRAIAAYNRGAAAYNGGDREGAIAAFKEAVELDPDLLEAQRALAEAALKDEDPETAAAAAAAVRRLDPEDAEGARLGFEAALRTGDNDALAEAARGLTAEQKMQAARIVYNRGVEATQRQALEDALTLFHLALELDPTLAPGHSALASTLYNAGRYGEALTAVERFLELAPDDRAGLQLRAMAAEAAGETEKAAEALEALAAVDPEGAVAEIASRARSLFQSGEIEAAEAEALRVLELAPDHPDALFTLGLIAVNRGATEKAKEYFQKIVTSAPDSPRAAEAQDMLQYL